MRIFLATILTFCALADESLAQAKRLPQFADFPAPEVSSAKSKAPVINSARARLFRTMLKSKAEGGPNFAGHYTLAVWGCGSDCKALAIINVRTGKVHFLPGLYNVFRVPYQAEESLQYQSDSRLLIVVGGRAGDTGGGRKYYYVWSKDRLRLIRSTKDFRKNAYPF